MKRFLWLICLGLLFSFVACGVVINAPSNISLTALPGAVGLTWEDNSRNEDGFIIYRKQAATQEALESASFEQHGETEQNVTEFEDEQVTTGQLYQYEITAKRGAMESAVLRSATAIRPEPANYRLDVLRIGQGGGVVESEPSGISCDSQGQACSAGFSEETQLVLTATPNANSVFVAWGGACSGTDVCKVLMDSDKEVSVNFAQASRTLSLDKSGDGTGIINSVPAGLACPEAEESCSADFVRGTVVSLQATADELSVFTGWSGACSGLGACTVTLEEDVLVKAGFRKIQAPEITSFVAEPNSILLGQTALLSWTLAEGDESNLSINHDIGAVTGSEQLIEPDRTRTYTLRASNIAGTDTAKVTVTVTPAFKLTVTVVGNGRVIDLPGAAGIDCGDDCSELYAQDSEVRLRARDGTLLKWEGCDNTPTALQVCVLSMNSSRSVVATFQ